MGVADQVDWQAIHKDGDISTMICVKTTEEILGGFSPALMLGDHQTRDVVEDLLRSRMRS